MPVLLLVRVDDRVLWDAREGDATERALGGAGRRLLDAVCLAQEHDLIPGAEHVHVEMHVDVPASAPTGLVAERRVRTGRLLVEIREMTGSALRSLRELEET